MGACASSIRNSSVMKSNMPSSGSNRKPNNHLLIPPSPVKEKPPIINGDVPVKPQWSPLHSVAKSRDFGGSKEETFYDSQAWLESDCEDEFMSVNGEFTPSRGNTPVHHNFRAITPMVKVGALTVEDQETSSPLGSSPSPSKKKKRLSELFKESLRDNHEGNAEPDHENGPVEGTLGRGSGRGGLKSKKERWVETVHMPNCLPRVLSTCRPVTSQQTGIRRK